MNKESLSQKANPEDYSSVARNVESAIKRANIVASNMYLFSNLGVSRVRGGETVLLNELAQKIIKIEIYDLTSFLNSSYALTFAKKGFSKVLKWKEEEERENKEALKILEHDREEIRKKYFKTQKGRKFSRLVLLAVNDLIARSTTEAGFGGQSKLTVDHETVLLWSLNWKPQIDWVLEEPGRLTPRARQKDLLYK